MKNKAATETAPVRIQRSRQHKQISPNGLPIVYVGRPTIWGNPFRLMGDMIYVDAGHRRKILSPWVCYHDGGGYTEADVVALFRDLMADLNSHQVEDTIYQRFRLMRDKIIDLRGKNLSCWCQIGSKCHADVLLEIANR